MNRLTRALRSAALWAAVVLNSAVAITTPVVVGWAVEQVVEVATDPRRRGDLSDLLFPLVAATSVLAGLYLVVGYWRIMLRKATAQFAVRLWALSLGYNTLLLLFLTLVPDEPLRVVSEWALFMAGLSGYELFEATRAGPQNPRSQADPQPPRFGDRSAPR